MPCLGKRVRREAAFGKGQGQAAVRNVVGRSDEASRRKGREAIDEALFGVELDGGRFAGDDSADRSGIFRGGEFARKSRGADGARSSIGVRTVEKKDDVARVAEGHFKHAGNVVENAEHADDGSGIDRFAEGFVVEADVASGDGRAESQRSFGYAVDHLRKLPHDFGLFRAAEVEAVRGARGRAPLAATLRAASATACIAPRCGLSWHQRPLPSVESARARLTSLVFGSLMRTTAASLAPGPASVFVRTEVSYCSVIQRLGASVGEASSRKKFGVRFVASGAKGNQSFSDSTRGAGRAIGRW